ncbi:hypothetical protein BA195_06690 [Tenacibaculum soleae]|uniref:Uncharacterized protein n=1 Tax=Tenacibaculum soleae TaxID=447689 RepID=A0A1B9Y3F8_9FLAO|nr:hypothetical protein [Tenacibaculum soleae]OCK44358.1 hypothetical protein BA195_06690 [Tenacibaculum soleae]
MGKIIEKQIDINSAMSTCIRSGVKVYPVPVGRLFAIEVEKHDGSKKRYDELVTSKDVARAQRKTYIAYARLILKTKQDA